jgi:hypothetical protein
MGWLNKRRVSKTISFRLVKINPEEISVASDGSEDIEASV